MLDKLVKFKRPIPIMQSELKAQLYVLDLPESSFNLIATLTKYTSWTEIGFSANIILHCKISREKDNAANSLINLLKNIHPTLKHDDLDKKSLVFPRTVFFETIYALILMDCREIFNHPKL